MKWGDGGRFEEKRLDWVATGAASVVVGQVEEFR